MEHHGTKTLLCISNLAYSLERVIFKYFQCPPLDFAPASVDAAFEAAAFADAASVDVVDAADAASAAVVAVAASAAAVAVAASADAAGAADSADAASAGCASAALAAALPASAASAAFAAASAKPWEDPWHKAPALQQSPICICILHTCKPAMEEGLYTFQS